jgi:hypothetical protein
VISLLQGAAAGMSAAESPAGLLVLLLVVLAVLLGSDDDLPGPRRFLVPVRIPTKLGP